MLTRWFVALFSAALSAYPEPFRTRFGAAMLDAYRDALEARAARGLLHQLRFAATAIVNAIVSGIAERRHTGGPKRRLLRGVAQDVRFAWRMIRRQRAASALSIATLAIGLGATTTMFSLVDASLLRGVDLPRADRLVVAFETTRGSISQVSYETLADWTRETTSFAALTAIRAQNVNLTGLDEPTRVRGAFVTPPFFAVAGVAPAMGRAFEANDDVAGAAPVAVISHAVWQRHFGGRRNVVGEAALLNNVSFTIVGVMPEGFTFPFDAADVWLPARWTPGNLTRAARSFTVFGRLRDHAGVQQASAELGAVAARLADRYPQTNRDYSATILPLHEWLTDGTRDQISLVFGLVLVLLAAACANVTSLNVASTAARRAEIGVRAALGAGWSRIARQFLTEHVVLALIGGSLGVALAWILVPAVVDSAPVYVFGLERAEIDWRVLLFSAVLTLITGIASGVVPAIHWAGQVASASLASGRTIGDRKLHRVHAGLVVLQVAFAAVLLTTGGLLVKSYRGVMTIEPGFRTEGLHTLEYRLPANKYTVNDQPRFHDDVVARVAAVPGVLGAAGVRALPLSGNGNVTSFRTDRSAPNAEPSVAELNTVTDDYFSLLGIPLLQGRSFDTRDTSTAPMAVIISKSLADREWPGENPLGREMRPVGADVRATVIGVVGDVRHRTLLEEERPTAYLRNAQSPGIFMTLVARVQGDPSAMAESIRRAVWSVDPQQPVWKERTLESLVLAATQRERFLSGTLVVFSAAALILVLSGLQGTMNQAVSRRTREIGLRMALGAERSTVLMSVLRGGVKTTLIGLAGGLLISVWTARLVAGLLYQTSPLDAAPYAATALLLTVVSLAACYLPARRAASISPSSVLR